MESSDRQVQEYLKVLSQDPGSRVFAPLSELLRSQGKLDDAEEVCRQGLSFQPEFSDGHLALAKVLFAQAQYSQALQEIKIALKLNPRLLSAYATAASIFLAQGKTKQASAACMKIIDIDPNHEEARRILKETGAANQRDAGPNSSEQVRSTTAEFRATAGTLPSQNPARSLLSPDVLFKDTDDFGIPTRSEKSRRVRAAANTPIPKLPDPPPLAEPAGSDGSAAAHRTPYAGGRSGMRWAQVDRVQAIIESYTSQAPVVYDFDDPLRVPRARRLKIVLALLAIGGVLVYLAFLGWDQLQTDSSLPAPTEDLLVVPLSPADREAIIPAPPPQPSPSLPDDAQPIIDLSATGMDPPPTVEEPEPAPRVKKSPRRKPRRRPRKKKSRRTKSRAKKRVKR